MPLTLVTGPANAEKAGRVLDAVRSAARAGRDPWLVVPNADEVDAFRRELARDGLVLGVSVVTFRELGREMARRAGVSTAPLGELAAERVARGAVRELQDRGELRALAASAATAGFSGALAKLCGELAAARSDPRSFSLAMGAWAEDVPGRDRFASELAALYAAYRRRLDRLGRPDGALHACRVCDELRRRPAAWGGTPVALYGFDDLTAGQLDAVETLATGARAPLVVSLPFEPRAAFAGRQETRERLARIAGEIVELDAGDADYAEPSRAALQGLERAIFEPDAERVEPGDAIAVLVGGGERAELELVAERLRTLHERDGVPFDEMAVAVRDPAAAGSLIREVLGAAGVPFALEHRLPAERTSLGRGLLALLRCALLDGDADDLLTWLRTPGVLRRASIADRLERDLRRAGRRGLPFALERLEELGGPSVPALGRLTGAAERGGRRLCDALALETRRLLAGPWRAPADGAWRGSAPLLAGPELVDAAAAREILVALDELGSLAAAERALAPDPRELHDLLAALPVDAGERPRPGAVTVADPLLMRVRRVRVLALARLQEGVFPKLGSGEPFLGDAERAEIEAATAVRPTIARLRLPRHEDRLDAERYLLYSAISRPTERLVLSWHLADDDGEPAMRSPFAEDVLDCLDRRPDTRERRRGAVEWDPGENPGEVADRLALALVAGLERGGAPDRAAAEPLGDPAVLASLAERVVWSPSELEAYARCPVRWFVEHLLRPGALEPDAEPLGRGRVQHAVLERTLSELRDRGLRLDGASLPRAIEAMRGHLEVVERDNPISGDPRRRAAERHRVEADLVRALVHEAAIGSSFAPCDFELAFGVDEGSPSAPLADGLELRGRIDRIDRRGEQAIVVDYKGRGRQGSWRSWLDEGRLQAPLYALALERLEERRGTRVVGALYQPVGAAPDKLAARGFLLEGADEARADVAADADDRIAAGELAELGDRVRAVAVDVVAAIRSGHLEPCPGRCGQGRDEGCAHPSICRAEG